MPKPPVIDSHIHFWDPSRMRYAWLDQLPGLRRAFRPEHLQTGAVRINAMVFVEADRRQSEALTEVEWASALSAPSRPPVAGIVAAAALESPGADGELDALAGSRDVKGVRRLLQDTRPGFALEPSFVRAVQSLAGRDLVFDVCVRQHQLAEVRALVEQCPEVTFVLDHVGKPRVGPLPDRSWLVEIERLAALSNVRCKLSGLTSEVLDPIGFGGQSGLFRPYLEHAVQQFGPSRCMFGSDWPVASLTVTYEGWYEYVLAALMDLSAAEIAQVLGGTAVQVYRLAPTRLGHLHSGRDDAKVPTGPDRQEGGEDAWR
jgi:L-fuconolactonase